MAGEGVEVSQVRKTAYENKCTLECAKAMFWS